MLRIVHKKNSIVDPCLLSGPAPPPTCILYTVHYSISHGMVSVLWITKLTNNFSRKLLCFGPPASANCLCFCSLYRQIRAHQRALTYEENEKSCFYFLEIWLVLWLFIRRSFSSWILARTVLLRISWNGHNPYTKLEEVACQKDRQAKTKLFRTYCKNLHRLILTDCTYISRSLLAAR